MMKKRALCLLVSIFALVAVSAQDFATKFLAQCPKTKEIKCHTIGPKMMEKLMDIPSLFGTENNDNLVASLLSKLKSARIVTCSKNSKKLYRSASRLMDSNKNRFVELTNGEQENRKIFVRKHDEVVRELVMLNLASTSSQENFVIVNFTGEMDENFMNMLAMPHLRDNE